MEKKRKIKCDCGKYLVEGKEAVEGIETEAMVCPKCKFVTFTKEQAKKYAELKKLHEIIDAERKIIKIGNSMGITLPDKLQEMGVKVGKKVRTEALTEKSFKVEIIDA